MFRLFTVYWYRAFDLKDNTAEKVVTLTNRLINGVCTLYVDINNSPSIFTRTPIDAIWEQRLFEIERNYLKANGYNYPLLRPSRPPNGYIRVEYYTSMKNIRKGKQWDCWKDVPLLSTGELDVEYVQQMWGMEPNGFALVDPVRDKEFQPVDQNILSPIGIYLNTHGGQLPLRFVEPNVSFITRTKRNIRAFSLMMACILTSLFQSTFSQSALEEHRLATPLPATYSRFYNFIRRFRSGAKQRSGDPMPFFTTDSVESDMSIQPRFDWTMEGRLTTWLWFVVKIAAIIWVVIAELTSTGFVRQL